MSKNVKQLRIDSESRLLIFGVFILMVVLIVGLFFEVLTFGGTVDVLVIDDFSGVKEIFHEGFGDSNQTIITGTDWASDSITVTGGLGSRTLLDQTIIADEDHTQINRLAIYIGPGFVNTQSTYYGSKVANGEDNTTGIYIEGNKYGVLIENGTLEFDEFFGGIEKSVAVTSGDYILEQFGFTGDSFGGGNNSASFSVSGDNSATLISLVFGSTPQPGLDAFDVETIGWAKGDGTYFFSGSSGDSSTSGFFEFGYGEITLDAIFEAIEINNEFEVPL